MSSRNATRARRALASAGQRAVMQSAHARKSAPPADPIATAVPSAATADFTAGEGILEVKCGPRATFMRNQAIKATIQRLRVKHKRLLFLLVRTTRHVSDQSFFPRCGFTAGQFCVLQALNEGSRSKRTTASAASARPRAPLSAPLSAPP